MENEPTQIFTGRFDKLDDEQFYIDLMKDLSKRYGSIFTIMSFENKTKTGLPTKDHYHFIMICPFSRVDYITQTKTGVIKITHDAVRKYITKQNKELLGGAKASLKNTEDKNKALFYVLKQQNVIYTDLDEPTITEWLDYSKNYQEEIKINSWAEHFEEIIKQITEIGKFDRPFLLMYIIKYIKSWNEIASTSQQIDPPRDIRHTVRQIEFRCLPAEEIFNLNMDEYGAFFYPTESKVDYYKSINEYYTGINYIKN